MLPAGRSGHAVTAAGVVGPDSLWSGLRPPRDYVDPKAWSRPDMRQALARRDIAAAYRLLQRYGISQRTIAAKTGQSQSEVSEIIAGRRQVVSYDLLLRIADGLRVPRGWLGLAYDADTEQLVCGFATAPAQPPGSLSGARPAGAPTQPVPPGALASLGESTH